MSIAGNSWGEDIKRYLEAHPKVVLALLFGSFSRDKARAGSDVDVAVYLASPYSSHDVTDIWNHLEDLAHRDVDLVVLNDAPPGISWAAMKGEILVDKDPKLRLELMLERSGEAEDFREFQMGFWRERARRWRDKGVGPVT